jgi:hypothetical protein
MYNNILFKNKKIKKLRLMEDFINGFKKNQILKTGLEKIEWYQQIHQ